jgi:hypothetical protein
MNVTNEVSQAQNVQLPSFAAKKTGHFAWSIY